MNSVKHIIKLAIEHIKITIIASTVAIVMVMLFPHALIMEGKQHSDHRI